MDNSESDLASARPSAPPLTRRLTPAGSPIAKQRLSWPSCASWLSSTVTTREHRRAMRRTRVRDPEQFVEGRPSGKRAPASHPAADARRFAHRLSQSWGARPASGHPHHTRRLTPAGSPIGYRSPGAPVRQAGTRHTPRPEIDQASASAATTASSVSIAASSLKPPASSTFCLISSVISGFSMRKTRAFSFPWPSCMSP